MHQLHNAFHSITFQVHESEVAIYLILISWKQVNY